MKCVTCGIDYTTTYNYERHLSTLKHQQKVKDTTNCVVCGKQYKTRNGLWKHGKICQPTTVDQVKQDPNLILHVMEQMMRQQESMMLLMKQNQELLSSPTIINSPNSNNKFNLQVFLNEECKDAINWQDFIDNLPVTLADIDVHSNLTDKITATICTELERLGVYRRPIHCLDIKRKKNCVKDKNEWKKEATDVVRKGIGEVSNKFKFVLHDWAKKNPEWHENQGLAEQFIDMMNVYMREPDEDKCIQYLYKKVSLDDKKKN